MSIDIDDSKFEMAHELFKHYMKSKSNGVPFANFQHPFLIDDEIAYKGRVYADAKDVLKLARWDFWRADKGNIIKAVQDACKPNVSRNLLEHRYGFANSSEGALYRVATPKEIAGVEELLYEFFLGGPSTPAEFGPRFDDFAEYLRSNRGMVTEQAGPWAS